MSNKFVLQFFKEIKEQLPFFIQKKNSLLFSFFFNPFFRNKGLLFFLFFLKKMSPFLFFFFYPFGSNRQT